ncbi:carbohydrate kinase family protein [Dyella caseinilytica]|uniref:Carbohydrate kinase family protein n=1 Tax=Dyella caseinilytica TaxID=1849581 RepID=A0ABX7GX49_9GAMM|nr:carbohydrate kinase family protein [Dyella caseinilytica]QRN54885.1 carbohydrate kinase family protein [Dyella caseinilytica]GFZ97673.1 ribokinase [Dyella caseinilytica]
MTSLDRPARILVIGEINVDFVFKGCHAAPTLGKEVLADDFVMTPGSSAMICAMGLARLGNPVTFHGKLGTDASGKFCLHALRDAGIDVTSLQPDSVLRTGVTASLSTTQDRALVTFPGAMAELRADEIEDSWLEKADHLHVSSYYLQRGLRPGCRQLFARAAEAGLTTSLDPGFDPEQRWENDLLDTLNEVDIFLPNEEELLAITGCSAIKEALTVVQNGRTQTIVKRGRRGCTSLREDQWINVPAYAVDAIDSTGAGDSFDAGFLHAWLREMSWMDCMRWGSACGSLSTRGIGGTTRQATVDEALALLAVEP